VEFADILLDQPKAGMVHQRADIVFRTGNITVDAYHPIAARKQGVAEMRTDKAGPSGDKNGFTISGSGSLQHYNLLKLKRAEMWILFGTFAEANLRAPL
jgi:hypothetical protein